MLGGKLGRRRRRGETGEKKELSFLLICLAFPGARIAGHRNGGCVLLGLGDLGELVYKEVELKSTLTFSLPPCLKHAFLPF